MLKSFYGGKIVESISRGMGPSPVISHRADMLRNFLAESSVWSLILLVWLLLVLVGGRHAHCLGLWGWIEENQ